VHEDPTRHMDQPGEPPRGGFGEPPGRGPDDGLNSRAKFAIAGLVAIIVGLIIAVVVIGGGDGKEATTATTETQAVTETRTQTQTLPPRTVTETTATTDTVTVPPPPQDGGQPAE
jgi:hypothetical protein